MSDSRSMPRCQEGNTCGAYSICNLIILRGGDPAAVRNFDSIVREVAIGGDYSKGANPLKMARYIKEHLEDSSIKLYGDSSLIDLLLVEAMESTEHSLEQEYFNIETLIDGQYFIGVFGLGQEPKNKAAKLKEILTSGCAGDQLHYMVCFRNKANISYCDSNVIDSWKNPCLFSSLVDSDYYFTGMGILVSFPPSDQ